MAWHCADEGMACVAFWFRKHGPVTLALLRFDASSFSKNPGLCGQIVMKNCNSSARLPFFHGPSMAAAPIAATPSEKTPQLQGVAALSPPKSKTHKGIAVILGFSFVILLLLIGSFLSFLMALKKRRRKQKISVPLATTTTLSSESASASTSLPRNNNLEINVKKIEMKNSGNLVFCKGEEQNYSLDQLMTGSAEMLGRGSIGTTYKAVLDNWLIVCVKRLDVKKTVNTSKEVFERHIQVVGDLNHPNLVPLRAYFQAKEEKLKIIEQIIDLDDNNDDERSCSSSSDENSDEEGESMEEGNGDLLGWNKVYDYDRIVQLRRG